jgi:hypothetical protein
VVGSIDDTYSAGKPRIRTTRQNSAKEVALLGELATSA